jgi:hypothetical protein
MHHFIIHILRHYGWAIRIRGKLSGSRYRISVKSSATINGSPIEWRSGDRVRISKGKKAVFTLIQNFKDFSNVPDQPAPCIAGELVEGNFKCVFAL